MTAAQGVKDYIGPLKFGDWHVGQLQWNRIKKYYLETFVILRL